MVDLKQYTDTAKRYSWMKDIQYSIVEFAPDGKTVIKETILPDGMFDAAGYGSKPVTFKIKWTNQGVK